MIASRNRFHGLNSLRTVYKYGQTIHRQQFSLKYNLNSKRQTYRCAVVVAKKVEKSAVGRNRIRRRIFEIVRQQAPKINKPYDLVFSVFSDAVAQMPAAELQQQLTEMLREASVIDDKS